MKKIYTFLLAMMPVFAFAQFQVGGNLTIFSEDGDKFFLILNGERQNDEPQTNIRIEDLPQPYYSAKVEFLDKTILPLIKKNLMISDADGKLMDVTYKIRKDKMNKAKMNFFSMIPVQQDFMPPSNMYVRHWGQPAPATSVGFSQTRTTTTTNSNTNTVGANVNIGGLNMNVSVTEPDIFGSTTTTTTTTTQGGQGGYSNPRQQTQPRGCFNNWPMNSSDFNAAKHTIEESSFDDTKLTAAKSIVTNNCLSTDQIVQVCQLFSFEESKLDFAKFAHRYCTDPKNYFKVNNVFSFSSSKESLSEFTQQAH